MQHEEFIQGIRGLVLARREMSEGTKARIEATKLTYGPGDEKLRGVCYHEAWAQGDEKHAFVEVCAHGEESVVQLVGTTIHELAHAACGAGEGHGLGWKAMCKVLGLLTCEAGGQNYTPEHFDADLWAEVMKLGTPQDGNPAFSMVGGGLPFTTPAGVTVKARPCPLGFGTRGGTSRGKGSGSRMRLYHCSCTPPVKVRCASDELNATCNVCCAKFDLQPGRKERV